MSNMLSLSNSHMKRACFYPLRTHSHRLIQSTDDSPGDDVFITSVERKGKINSYSINHLQSRNTF